MKNLVVLRTWSTVLEESAACLSASVSVNSDERCALIFTTNSADSSINFSRLLLTDLPIQHVQSVRLSSEDIPTSAQVVASCTFPGEDLVGLALSSGHLLTLAHYYDGAPQLEVIGSVPEGIMAAAWSPDFESLVLVSSDYKLILMNRDFYPEWEESISGERPTQKFVNVGWGKKETQFHGSAGKQAALAKQSITPSLASYDDRQVRIVWRGDGAFFALSLIDMVDGQPTRRIRIYNRKGGCESETELVSGMEHCLSWMPSGELIASSARHPSGKQEIIFFERNGLRHGEFSLHPPVSPACANSTIKELMWNSDSTILLVHVVEENSDHVCYHFIQLWTCSNYHWYLKQTIPIEGEIIKIYWDPEAAARLFVLGSPCKAYTFEFSWDMYKSAGINDTLSMVAVTDGSKLLLTPFAITNVPPPMSHVELEMGMNPTNVSIYVEGASGILAATGLGCLKLFKLEKTIDNLVITLSTTIDLDEIASQVVALSLEHVVIKSMHSKALYHYSCQSTDQHWTLRLHIHEDTLTSVGRIAWATTGEALIEDYDGTIFLYSAESETIITYHKDEGGFLNWIASVKGKDSFDYLVGLSSFGKLMAQGQVVLPHCTSFVLTCNFLIATTIDNNLRFYPLSESPETWTMIKEDGEESSRKIELGAVIVCGVPLKSSLILQMPRGNIEIIYPRAMTLTGIRDHLVALKYREAYLTCRRHRIDLNFIHDNDPELFISTISLFVSQVHEPEYLNLFISSLRSDNVAMTKYSGFGSGNKKAFTVEEKVNKICRLIREQLNNDVARYVETLMTTFVSQVPPDYRSALLEITLLSEMNVPSNLIEKSLKYLIFLVDVNVLFREALAMYQLPLALSIAKRSTKDPKEYMPFLEYLHELAPSPRCFHIDHYLGFYSKALGHLIQSEAKFKPQVFDYVCAHRLYPEALANYQREGTLERTELLVEYGKVLLNEGNIASALGMFKMARNYEKALEVAKAHGFWQDALEAATKLEYTSEQISCIARTLIDILKGMKRYREAMFVGYSCVKDVDLIQSIIIEGQLWSDGGALVLDVDSQAVIVEAAVQCSNHFIEEIGQMTEDFGSKADRLIVLFKQLIEKLSQDALTSGTKYSGDGELGSISDSLSELSFGSIASTKDTRNTQGTFRTTTSGHSKTTTSHKSKKKADRHRLRGKPGSPYEKEYIRDGLRDLWQRAVGMSGQVGNLIRYLCENGKVDEASSLQIAFEAYEKLIEAQFSELICIQKEAYGLITEKLGSQFNNINESMMLGITIEEQYKWKVAFTEPALPMDRKWKLALFGG